MRDRLAHRLCNLILRHVATETYRRRITLIVRQGIESIWGPTARIAWENHLDPSEVAPLTRIQRPEDR